MNMAENKTQRNDGDVLAYLESVQHKRRREDSLVVKELMEEVTGEPAEMWGTSIVGFGSYHYRYASGREGDFMLTGFAPRKQALTLYIMGGHERYKALMTKLGKHRTGSSCLYINKLADVDLAVLRELIAESVAYMRSADHIEGD
jgi:nucleoid DNA-binding protein